jgi:hypothetical protein
MDDLVSELHEWTQDFDIQDCGADGVLFRAIDCIEILKRELAEERHSREVAAKHAWRFSDALHKIKDMKPDPEFGMVPIDTAREVARKALEGKE